MIRYVKCEIYKLLGKKYIWILLVIMIIINMIICAYVANNNINKSLPSDIIQNFFNEYFNDPDNIITEYEERQQIKSERESLWRDAISRGDFEYDLAPLPNKYVSENESGFTDDTLFDELFLRRNYILYYPSTIQKVINMANANLLEYDTTGVSENSYIYKYQLRVIELYENAKDNVKIGLEYNRGWDNYFNYDIVNIFIFLILLVIGAVIFIDEKQSGFLPIIRVTKHGRTKTAVSKIITMLLITGIIVLIFIGTTFAVFGFIEGFSSPFNAIQVFSEFTLSPYIISIGEYFILAILFKIFTFYVFTSIIMFISVYISNYVITYICGIGFLGLNLVLNIINVDTPLKYLNIIAATKVTPLIIRYRAINMFNLVIGYVPLILAILSITLICCSIGTIIKYNHRLSDVSDIRNQRFTRYIKIIKNRPNKIHMYSMSLYMIELYKTLISSRYIFVVIVVLIMNIHISNITYAEHKSYSDSIYYEYTTAIKGELTDQKRQYIIDERTFINDILFQYDDMQLKYATDEIDYMEYREYINNYYYAYSRSEHLIKIEDHIRYIDQREAETGVKAWTLYDTGWKLLLHSKFNILLYGIILLLYTECFVNERRSKSSNGSFAQILRVTKKGRHKTFKAKIVISILISVILTILFQLPDIIFLIKNYDLPAINAPLMSIETFSSVDINITIAQYLFVFGILRIFGNILLTSIICALSELINKTIFTMCVVIAVTILPMVLIYFGLSIMRYIDFTGILSATSLWLTSAKFDLFNDYIFIMMFIILWTLFTLLISFFAYKKWNY